MSPFYESLKTDTRTREKIALPAGTYQDLKIVAYLGEKPTTDPDLIRHSFLVASGSVEGTAFLSFNLRALWLHPSVVALAFNAGDAAVAAGDITQEELDATKELLAEFARKKVTEANTPEDGIEEAAAEYLEKKLLVTIRIAVGTIFRLQDWKGVARNPQGELAALLGTVFAGSVEPGINPQVSDVKSVFSKKGK